MKQANTLYIEKPTAAMVAFLEEVKTRKKERMKKLRESFANVDKN